MVARIQDLVDGKDVLKGRLGRMGLGATSGSSSSGQMSGFGSGNVSSSGNGFGASLPGYNYCGGASRPNASDMRTMTSTSTGLSSSVRPKEKYGVFPLYGNGPAKMGWSVTK